MILVLDLKVWLDRAHQDLNFVFLDNPLGLTPRTLEQNFLNIHQIS